jgi:signal-transduction protein with cAMP-binding, CBS, and nucleotidyltransferase domain
LTDIAQRFKARKYVKGDMLKDFNEDPTYVWFICSGTVGIFERKVKVDEDENDDHKSSSNLGASTNSKMGMEIIMLNTYHAGESFGDPEINMCTPFSSRICITSNETKIVQISRETFYQIYQNRLNAINLEKQKSFLDNFSVFKTWDAKKLKIVAEAAKTRIMQKDEVLFED